MELANHTLCIWISLAMAFGLNILWKQIALLFGRKIPRRFDDWQYELEQKACDVIRADLASAEAKKRLVEMIGQLPSDFDATAWLGVRLADHVQRAVLSEAERQGIVDGAIVRRVFPPMDVPQENPAPLASTPPPSLDDLGNVHWIGGQLHPRSASNS